MRTNRQVFTKRPWLVFIRLFSSGLPRGDRGRWLSLLSWLPVLLCEARPVNAAQLIPCHSFNLAGTGAAAGHQFGYAVATDGNFIFVGAPFFDLGKVYIFERSANNASDPTDDTWSQRSRFTTTIHEGFGKSVAIGGEWAVAGAPDSDASGDVGVGAIRFFHRVSGSWDDTTTHRPSDGLVGGHFGFSVAITTGTTEGDFAITGAPDGSSGRGAAYVFRRTGDTWVEEAKLVASDAQTSDRFGASVTIGFTGIGGLSAIVGAPGEDTGANNAGTAYEFVRDSADGTWSQRQILRPSDRQASSQFGFAVTLKNNRLVVGAPGAGNNPGRAYQFVKLFTCPDGFLCILQWSPVPSSTTGTLPRVFLPAPGDHFGASVAISDSGDVVGAPDWYFPFPLPNIPRPGLANVFRNGVEREFLNFGDVTGDRFGFSVAAAGSFAVIGSPGDDTGAGADAGSVLVYAIKDTDGDATGDACDNCRTLSNADQGNIDADDLGDVCDPDEDGDGVADPIDTEDRNSHVCGLDDDHDGCDDCGSGVYDLANDVAGDNDGDGFCPAIDNCPAVNNPSQIDGDHDTWGDACDNCLGVSNPIGRQAETSNLRQDGENNAAVSGRLRWFTLPPTIRDVIPMNNFLGPGYLQALKVLSNTSGTDAGLEVHDPLSASAPFVDFPIFIAEPGTYRLYVRMDGSNSNGNSLYARIVELQDGVGNPGIADWYLFTVEANQNFSSDGWLCAACSEATSESHCGTVAQWEIDVPKAYTLRFVPREDGVALDGFVFWPEDNGVPSLPEVEEQLDSDTDGIGDDCDNCPAAINPDQRDRDRICVGGANAGRICSTTGDCPSGTCSPGNGIGDVCDGGFGLGDVLTPPTNGDPKRTFENRATTIEQRTVDYPGEVSWYQNVLGTNNRGVIFATAPGSVRIKWCTTSTCDPPVGDPLGEIYVIRAAAGTETVAYTIEPVTLFNVVDPAFLGADVKLAGQTPTGQTQTQKVIGNAKFCFGAACPAPGCKVNLNSSALTVTPECADNNDDGLPDAGSNGLFVVQITNGPTGILFGFEVVEVKTVEPIPSGGVKDVGRKMIPPAEADDCRAVMVQNGPGSAISPTNPVADQRLSPPNSGLGTIDIYPIRPEPEADNLKIVWYKEDGFGNCWPKAVKKYSTKFPNEPQKNVIDLATPGLPVLVKFPTSGAYCKPPDIRHTAPAKAGEPLHDFSKTAENQFLARNQGYAVVRFDVLPNRVGAVCGDELRFEVILSLDHLDATNDLAVPGDDKVFEGQKTQPVGERIADGGHAATLDFPFGYLHSGLPFNPFPLQRTLPNGGPNPDFTGEIFPVNELPTDLPPEDRLLEVWFFKEGRAGIGAPGIFWPNRVVRFDPQFPDGTPETRLVIASRNGAGSYPENAALYAAGDFDDRNDEADTREGWNPNDEHAVLLDIGGTRKAFATRNDNPWDVASGHPYVLVQWKDTDLHCSRTGDPCDSDDDCDADEKCRTQWHMAVHEVVSTDEDDDFDYDSFPIEPDANCGCGAPVQDASAECSFVYPKCFCRFPSAAERDCECVGDDPLCDCGDPNVDCTTGQCVDGARQDDGLLCVEISNPNVGQCVGGARHGGFCNDNCNPCDCSHLVCRGGDNEGDRICVRHEDCDADELCRHPDVPVGLCSGGGQPGAVCRNDEECCTSTEGHCVGPYQNVCSNDPTRPCVTPADCNPNGRPRCNNAGFQCTTAADCLMQSCTKSVNAGDVCLEDDQCDCSRTILLVVAGQYIDPLFPVNFTPPDCPETTVQGTALWVARDATIFAAEATREQPDGNGLAIRSISEVSLWENITNEQMDDLGCRPWLDFGTGDPTPITYRPSWPPAPPECDFPDEPNCARPVGIGASVDYSDQCGSIKVLHDSVGVRILDPSYEVSANFPGPEPAGFAQKLPPHLFAGEIPLSDRLPDRIRFDVSGHRLVFRGVMSCKDYEDLNKVEQCGPPPEDDPACDFTTLGADDAGSAYCTALGNLFLRSRCRLCSRDCAPNPSCPSICDAAQCDPARATDTELCCGLPPDAEGKFVTSGDALAEPISEAEEAEEEWISPTGHVTLAFQNDASCEPLPVSLEVWEVSCPPAATKIRPIQPTCPFNERLSLQLVDTITGQDPFAGASEGFNFRWEVNIGDPINEGNWQPFAQGPGLRDIVIEGGGGSILALVDSHWRVRYCGYANCPGPGGPCPEESEVFDSAKYILSAPQFVEGWVTRVLRGITPFDQRVDDFHRAAVATTVSMIQQAGIHFEGPIALNCAPENINSKGLIEIYETVLRRARGFTIDVGPGHEAANEAIIKAAGKISDLYMLLGHEAFADASDPTVALFHVDGVEDRPVDANVIFPFLGFLGVDDLLKEELALLRGRRDGDIFPPDLDNIGARSTVYQRLVWNIGATLTEGEPAYANNYQVTNLNQAKLLYPQGHGDAWGHYLTATKQIYDLLKHPNFTWSTDTEEVLIDGTAVEVNYRDERRFAKAAAAKAQTGAAIVSLVSRELYDADPKAQNGYPDVDPERSWGLIEWGQRAGQAAYFDWLTVNALLDDEDDPASHERPIQQVDRSTVPELRDIAASFTEIETVLSNAGSGLNPLGLATNVVPFGLNPAEIDAGKTHFDQIKERAIRALVNAVAVFDQANDINRRLRAQQDEQQQFDDLIAQTEEDFTSRLIEIFGRPFPEAVGEGRTYSTAECPNEQQCPDIFEFDYVDLPELIGNDRSSPATTLEVHFKGFDFDRETGEVETHPRRVVFNVSTEGFGLVKPTNYTSRAEPGEIQFARSELFQALARFVQAEDQYRAHLSEIDRQILLLESLHDVNAEQLRILEFGRNVNIGLSVALHFARAGEVGLRRVASAARLSGRAVGEAALILVAATTGVPLDPPGMVRNASILMGDAAAELAEQGADAASLVQFDLQLAKEIVNLQQNIDIVGVQGNFQLEQAIQALEGLMRQTPQFRLNLAMLEEALNQARGKYQSALGKGLRLLEQRTTFRQRTARQIAEHRFADMAFRVFRNDALQKYRAQFDLATQYVFLAAKAYDYDTNLLGSDSDSGRAFLSEIVRQRSLGLMTNGFPSPGGKGLAAELAELEENFERLRGQLGFNSPDEFGGTNGLPFSLRWENFRIPNSPGFHAQWADTLSGFQVDDLNLLQEYLMFCTPIGPRGLVEPGIVIPFSTVSGSRHNLFGQLSEGDVTLPTDRFAIKIHHYGVRFTGLPGPPLDPLPNVYLVPVGADIQRIPDFQNFRTREWHLLDQTLPRLKSTASMLADLPHADWIPWDSIDGNGSQDIVKRRLIPQVQACKLIGGQCGESSKLIGRSVWNTRWLLIIPGSQLRGTDPANGVQTFIHGPDGRGGVTDIHLIFRLYGYVGEAAASEAEATPPENGAFVIEAETE